MRLEKISTKTLRQKVYDQLRQKIISAEILPGEVLTLRGLAKELGVSLIPVREDLFKLESEKVVVIESNKSIYVNKLTAEEMREALQIRLMLESKAAERACKLRPESALPRVKQLLKNLEDAIDDPKKFMEVNSQFHLEIYSYANSPLLLQIIDHIWARVGPYLLILSSKGANLTHSMRCHQGMYRAFVDGDRKKIRMFLRNDLEEAADFIMPYLNEN
jgi:DNA-binding GntR family transcriptional regulator